MRRKSILIRLLLTAVLFLVLIGGYILYRWFAPSARRSAHVSAWIRNPQAHPDWEIQVGTRCVEAVFLLPTSGYVGYLWRDSFRLGHLHQGIDIFGGTSVSQTPVVAAYSGYLTRLSDWKASVIVRIPDDPLQPGRQIWTYYTHMADPQGNSFIVDGFPPGTVEQYVKAGTLLGYQGNYSGDPHNPTGVHLHFSIVLDDGNGQFRNELEVSNTIDPSPYLGLRLNAETNPGDIPICR